MPLKQPIASLLLAQVAFLGAGLAAAAEAPLGFAVSPNRGGLVSLSVDGRNIPLPAENGGFRLFDATDKKDIALPQGTVARAAGKTSFDCQGPDVRLHAEFTPRGDYVLVAGELENLRRDNRGFLLDYRLPRLSADAVFCNDLDHAVTMSDSLNYEGGVSPIAAMCGKDLGLGMAIPPTHPTVFGMVANAEGMSVRFYLGTSPATRRFPNRAPFAFMLYVVEPAWGFRSALSKYYGFFPDYYTPRLKRDGLFMFQMGDRLPVNIDQYGFDLVETQSKALAAGIARDAKHGIASFPYMIVGQREIKFLPALPKDYDEAMAVYAKWSVADHAGHDLTKENAASQGDIHLKEEVETSACKTRDGKYCTVLRNTPWGGNSISFKMNPNPDLFQDQRHPNVGSYALDLVERWMKEHPQYAGSFVDSLGANWPAVLNYRKDHFPYARYPLTVDPQGRVALQNVISHYEYIETLRARMRAEGRLVLANGVYAYKSKGAPTRRVERQALDKKLNEFAAEGAPAEHYRPGAKLGRFFCAALLDAASSEAGVRANVERCKDVRVFMGKKHYAFLNYSWEDGSQVEEFVNKSLCYGIFASTSTNFFTGVQYENHPQGYPRDKPLLDWYVPLVRRLSRAGWEPVRYAAVDDKDICCERFGSGDTVYFTLYNDGTTKRACTLEVELRSLGLAEGTATFAEIARQAPLTRPKANSVALELEPKRTYVIELAKRGSSD
jgi:hypothetical protein